MDYLKQKFGPAARHLSSVVSQLVAEGKLEVRRRDYFGYEKQDYIVLLPVLQTALSNAEIELLTDVIDYVSGKSAREISELSHDTAWQWAEMGERIPYAAALGLAPDELTQSDIADAKSEARRIRPQIEAERRERELL